MSGERISPRSPIP